ncbi:uncharacterized protein LOC111885871 isoform X5 [Lactuca sativa]|uniref:uncharacterized protein LOC111885871 isoform X5 n=1 Tax=Lactuca sativa TaxID=4236 RepID=UPI0022AF8C1D|nr:uncharacterized protein LOC111885871 isoform X5 [Lactuca sativa]
MEQLKELEQVQNIMLMIQSTGAIDSSNNTNADSNRFLANFILFMMQPCGELDMNQKCKLISNHFPKISSAFNKESSPQLCDKGNIVTEASLSHHCDDDMSVGLLQTDCADVAMVTLDSMQRANSTLQDFCRSYFMFHEMDANNAESIFKYLPLLSFTESYIYQLDTINEKLLQLPSDGIPDSDMMTPDWILRFIKSFKNDTFKPLAVLLESYGIYTDRIRDELKCGEEYWALERKLCSALTNKQEDDVLENNFNILRMFVRIHGASSAPAFLAKTIIEAEKKYNSLLNTLDPQLSFKYQKRCEEATKEGGKVFGPPLGTWSIPPIIEDEDLYRTNSV